ncbi:MAG TPA: hypothetical protein VG867_06725 [Rhizomicrobium sp.]|nr:hypothetical protein [Rhizomicrobium sp.]
MRKLSPLLFLLFIVPARAAQFDFAGYADLRLIAPDTSDRSATDGGLGKLRYGKGDGTLQFAGATGQGTVLLTPELLVSAVARVDTSVRPQADLLEAYVRYRPVSTTHFRWSARAGAFFAPFSLENTEIGWAPYWTLTPSAINTWFGDELRTIGAEGTLEWRFDDGTLKFVAAGFGLNEPAGVMMADRGWTISDRPTGLFEELRIPDATLILFHKTPPDGSPIFAQYDGNVGWYAGAAWKAADGWRVEAYRYDNEANPSAHKDDYFAWRTKFWDFGASKQMDTVTLLAQAVTGKTTIAPSAAFQSTTDFDSAYLLFGWEKEEWRLAARLEEFHTRTTTSFGGSPATSEAGGALTLSASMLPNDWLKLTAEAIFLNSRRGERTIQSSDPRQGQTQLQLSARFYLN